MPRSLVELMQYLVKLDELVDRSPEVSVVKLGALLNVWEQRVHNLKLPRH